MREHSSCAHLRDDVCFNSPLNQKSATLSKRQAGAQTRCPPRAPIFFQWRALHVRQIIHRSLGCKHQRRRRLCHRRCRHRHFGVVATAAIAVAPKKGASGSAPPPNRNRHDAATACTHALTSTWRVTDGYRTPGGRGRVHCPDQDAAQCVRLRASQLRQRSRQACEDT